MGDLLKEGTKHLTGLEETVLKNADAIKKLSQITRTSLGPNGMNKMVQNHIGKLFVTSDSATITRELEVVHPAAKMVVMASHQQESETGDATNLVVVLAGELITQAEALIRMGLHPSLVVQGYSLALERCLEDIEKLAALTVSDPRDEAAVTKCLRSVVAAKQYGHHDTVASLVARACIRVCPRDLTANAFNVDNVRVAKVPGGGVSDSTIVPGFVITRDTEGTIKHVRGARVAVFQGGIDLAKTETKGTVLMKSAKELLSFSKSEEEAMEAVVRAIAEAGVNVAVSGSSIGELAMHYLERYKIMVVKVLSKFDLRRLCKAVGAQPLLNLGAPSQDKLGKCDVVGVEEVGSTKCTVFRNEHGEGELATILIRASTQNTLDDIERAVDDGVNVYKQICRDGRFVAGAGACELQLASKIATYAESQPGLEQYAIRKFAEALEVVPRTLAENAGLHATQVISDLYAAHQAGKVNQGVDIEGPTGTCDAVEAGVLDHLHVKKQAIQFAANSIITVLRVDQIIMQRPAGGPKPPNQGGSGAMDAGDPEVV